MPPNQFKVLQCEHCGTLTYKRLTYKTVKCPICQKKMAGDPVELFSSARDAIAYIKEQKLRNAPAQGDWFETFG